MYRSAISRASRDHDERTRRGAGGKLVVTSLLHLNVLVVASLWRPEMDQWKDKGEYAFSRNGRAYTESERRELFLRKGQCPKCGIQTHKVSLRIKRVACNNGDVWQGVCIKCRPNAVPKDVLAAWTAKRAASGNNTTSTPHVESTKTVSIGNSARGASTEAASSIGTKLLSSPTANYSPYMTSHDLARTGEASQLGRLGRSELSSLERSPHSRLPFAAFNGLENDGTPSRGCSLTEWMSSVIDCLGKTDQVSLTMRKIPSTNAEVVDEACRVGSLERFLVKLRPTVVASNTNRSLWMSLSTASQTILSSGSKAAARQFSDQGYHVLVLDRLHECDDVNEAQHLMLSIVVFVTYEPASFLQANGIQTVLKVLPSFQIPIVLELASRCIYSLLSEEQQRLVEKTVLLLNRELAALFDGLSTTFSESSSTPSFAWGLRAVLSIFAVGDSERKALVLDELKDSEERLLFLSCLPPNDQFIALATWLVVDAMVDQNSHETLIQKASKMLLSLNKTSTMCCALGPIVNVLVSCLACQDEDIRRNVKMSASAWVFSLISACFDRNCHFASSCMWSLWSLSETTSVDITLIPSLVQFVADLSSPNGVGSDDELIDHAFLRLFFYGIISNVVVVQPVELCDTSLILPICALSNAAVPGVSAMQVEAFGLSLLYSSYPESFLEQHASSIIERYTNTFGADDVKEQLLGMKAFAYVASGNRAFRSPTQVLLVFDALASLFKAAMDPLLIDEGLDLILFLLSKCDPSDVCRKLLDGIGAAVLSPSAVDFPSKTAPIIQFCYESSSALPLIPTVESYFSSTMRSWQSQEGEVRDALWRALWAILAADLKCDERVLVRLFLFVVRLLRDCLQQKLTTDGRNPFDSPLIRLATGALSCASQKLPQPVSFNDADTVVSMIYYVMGNEREDTKSLEQVLESVIYLLDLSKGPLIECGVIVAIIDAMDEFEASATVQLRGSTALASLASSKTLQVILSILQTDGIDVLADALSSFPLNRAIQREVCRAFSFLSVDKESRMLLLSQSGVFLLTQAMRSFPDCCLVQEYASKALVALASDSPTCLNDPSVVDVAVMALTRHISCSTLQENMVSLIYTSASSCSACEALIVQLRGEDVILRTARRYLHDAAILELCFSAFGVLLCKTTSFCEEDIMCLIVNGMLTHVDDGLVLRRACKCLSLLQNDAPSVRLFGVEAALILVLRTHFRCRETSAAALLAYLSVGRIERNEEAIDLIVSTMWRFREDLDVLSIGCRILINAHPMSPIGNSCRSRFEAVLDSAKAMFAASCSDKATLAWIAIENVSRSTVADKLVQS
jgi:hypothetical protein